MPGFEPSGLAPELAFILATNNTHTHIYTHTTHTHIKQFRVKIQNSRTAVSSNSSEHHSHGIYCNNRDHPALCSLCKGHLLELCNTMAPFLLECYNWLSLFKKKKNS